MDSREVLEFQREVELRLYDPEIISMLIVAYKRHLWRSSRDN